MGELIPTRWWDGARRAVRAVTDRVETRHHPKVHVDERGAEVLREVTGLGELQDPGGPAHIWAVQQDVTATPDLRGARDVEPGASSPWQEELR